MTISNMAFRFPQPTRRTYRVKSLAAEFVGVAIPGRMNSISREDSEAHGFGSLTVQPILSQDSPRGLLVRRTPLLSEHTSIPSAASGRAAYSRSMVADGLEETS